MSPEDNPFLNGTYLEQGGPSSDPPFNLPPFPFLGTDERDKLRAAKVSGWLRELVEEGSEELKNSVVGYYQMTQYPTLMQELASVSDPGLNVPIYPKTPESEELGYSDDQILLGAVAIFGWQEISLTDSHI